MVSVGISELGYNLNLTGLPVNGARTAAVQPELKVRSPVSYCVEHQMVMVAENWKKAAAVDWQRRS